MSSYQDMNSLRLAFGYIKDSDTHRSFEILADMLESINQTLSALEGRIERLEQKVLNPV